jgi:polyisoprenoid-binding protein YceI
MNATVLATTLMGTRPPLLLHVTTPEHYAARRIDGAVNACVYEMAFLDAVRALAPGAAAPIVVYGEGAPSLDSEEAARKLREAGYTNVSDFRGGLREWAACALPIVIGEPLPVRPTPDGPYLVDPGTSVIRWTGHNLFNQHHGYLKLAEGHVEWSGGKLRNAVFTIDLGSIVCEDLVDATYHALLIQHLRSADFFDIERHPTARFEASGALPIPNATVGTPNYQIIGDFTLRGVTHEIQFPAVIAAADADHVTAQAQVGIDRTRWGSLYGSGKFFSFLGKHVVNDHFHLQLKIEAVRR